MKNISKNLLLKILAVAFFLSGASALIYQVLWVKQLTLIFGSQTLAISTILACFMGGLSLGSYIISKKAHLIKYVVLTYVILEIIIGLYAFIIPYLFDLTDNVYCFLWPLTNENYFLISILRFILVFLVLIVPTSMMGATLPLLLKHYINNNELIIKYTSILYCVNTSGAVFGAFICGFYLIEYFGISGTNYIAISLNFIAAFIAFIIHSKTPDINVQTEEQICLKFKYYTFSLIEKLVLSGMVVSGFTAMVYEVIWARQLVLIFGSTTYAYTSMLVIFLIGISLGSFSINRFFKDNNKNLYYFVVCELIISLLIIWGTYYYKDLIYIFNKLAANISPEGFIIPIMSVSFLLIFPATYVFGVLFPLSIKLFTPDYKQISERTGLIYSFNTLGCILGSIATGFILIPLIGLKYTIITGACLNLVIAAIIIIIPSKNTETKGILGLSTLALIFIFFMFSAKWQEQVITSGTYLNKSNNTLISKNSYLDSLTKKDVVYYKEGQHSTVSVVENKSKNKTNYTLYSNGKIEASTYFRDMRNQIAISYIPALLMNKHGDALIIGMGSGITASVLAQFPFKNIELVELEQAILGASKFFSNFYGNPLENKKIKYIIDDARNYLKVIDKKYDLILSEPSNVWVNGVANLFTREYYHIVKQRLKSDGILCQWIQIYDLKPKSIISVLKAMREEFKYVYLCHTKTSQDYVFLASQKPIKIDFDTIKKNINYSDKIKNDLANNFYITDPLQITNFFLGDNKGIDKVLYSYKNKVPDNNDNNAYLEFNAVKGFYSSPVDYFQNVYPHKSITAFRGLNKESFKNPSVDIFKNIANALKQQFKTSKADKKSREHFEYPLYKQQILIYADKNIENNFDKPEALELLAESYLFNNRITNGIMQYEFAASKGSTNPSVYKFLARYYNGLVYPEVSVIKPEKAIKYSLKAVELDPDGTYSYLILAISYYNDKKYLKSMENFNKYIDLSKKTDSNFHTEFFEYYSRSYFKN